MKFRAAMNDFNLMKELYNIVVLFSKFQKNLVLNIHPEKIILQIFPDVEAGQFIWSEIDCSSYFNQYLMEGVDKDQNQIYFTLSSVNLVRALSFLKNHTADTLKLKLAKLEFACLLVDIGCTMTSDADITPTVTHEIPIQAIPRSEWEQYRLPIASYDICVGLPSLKSLQSLLDKKKNISPSVNVYATDKGELSFIVETDIVTIGSHFKYLEVFKHKCRKPKDDEEPITEASCKVDSRKLALIMENINFSEVTMSYSIKQDNLLNVCCDLRGVALMNFILPAINFEDD